MMKIAVVYYSMTGNTEAMAEELAAGARESGAEVSIFTSAEFNADMLDEFQAIAFGCPAMGDEELEEEEFEPLFSACETKLGEKPIVLFGSYEWAEGQWMINWEERCGKKKLNVIGTLIAYDSPDDDSKNACRELGKKLAAELKN